jgi:hypothetical protein
MSAVLGVADWAMARNNGEEIFESFAEERVPLDEPQVLILRVLFVTFARS